MGQHLFRSIWPWRRRALFLSKRGQFSIYFDLVEPCDRFVTPSSRYNSHFVNTRKRWPLKGFDRADRSSRFRLLRCRLVGWNSLFRCSFVSCLYQGIHALDWSETEPNTAVNWSDDALVVWRVQTWYSSRRQPSHVQYFMQYITHTVFRDAYYFIDLANIQSAVCHIKSWVFVTCVGKQVKSTGM